MRACNCVNQCPGCGSCCQVDCGCRRRARGYVSQPGVLPVAPRPIEVGKTRRESLTEEQIRRIVREELDR